MTLKFPIRPSSATLSSTIASSSCNSRCSHSTSANWPMRSTGRSRASSSASSCCANLAKTSLSSTIHRSSSLPHRQLCHHWPLRQLSRCIHPQFTIRWQEATHRLNLRAAAQPQANISAAAWINNIRCPSFTHQRPQAVKLRPQPTNTVTTIIGDKIVITSPLDHHQPRLEGE